MSVSATPEEQTFTSGFRLLAMVLGVALLSIVSAPSNADALSDLNKEFRAAYVSAADQTLTILRASVPVLVNRFGQIAFYRPGVDQPELFSMDLKQYLEARAVAHTAAAVYVRLAPYGLGLLGESRLNWLATYRDLLSAAEIEVKNRPDIPEDVKAFQTAMLADVRRFVQRIHQRGFVDEAILDEMGHSVRSAIRQNLEFAATSQLEQLRAKVAQWKASYPALNWQEAVVVIVGSHQARNRYLQRQFFDWMLRDEPNVEARVVFAETMTPPPSLEKGPATDALVLLSKVMLDKRLSTTLFGDPVGLQSDVLGPAAAKIIANWPQP